MREFPTNLELDFGIIIHRQKNLSSVYASLTTGHVITYWARNGALVFRLWLASLNLIQFGGVAWRFKSYWPIEFRDSPNCQYTQVRLVMRTTLVFFTDIYTQSIYNIPRKHVTLKQCCFFMLGQRQRRWPNIKTTLFQCIVFVGLTISRWFWSKNMSQICCYALWHKLNKFQSLIVVHRGSETRLQVYEISVLK